MKANISGSNPLGVTTTLSLHNVLSTTLSFTLSPLFSSLEVYALKDNCINQNSL